MPNRMLRLGVVVTSLLLAAPVVSRAEQYFRAWIQEYDVNSLDTQEAKAIVMDSAGNVIVAGTANKPGSSATNAYLAKYDGITGVRLWQRTLSGTNNMVPTALAVDSTDAVIVVGTQNNTGDDDFFIAKYTSSGNVATGFTNPIIYDGTAGGSDIPAKVAVDSQDNIIVVGSSFGDGGAQSDFYTRKIGPTGAFIAEDRYNPFNRSDAATDVAVDGNNNVIVVGYRTNSDSSTGIEFVIRKLNSSLSEVWTKAFKTSTSGDGDGGATAVAVDVENSVYATGLRTNGSNHRGYFTIKYDAGGVVKWSRDTVPNDSDFTGNARDIVIGPDGHPVITGTLETAAGVRFARTIKYDKGNGGTLADISDFGFIGEDTTARQVAVDNAGNILVVGESRQSHGNGNSFTNEDIYVAKYDPTSGERVFFSGFDGTFSGDDDGIGIAVDRAGGFAITGSAIRLRNSIGRPQIVTIKFTELLADTGDPLPNLAGLPEDAEFAGVSAPAIGADGSLTMKTTYKSGKKKTNAILLQKANGGLTFPAVEGGTAPDANGAALGIFRSLSDPLIDDDGSIAFAGKMSGVPKSQANGVWTTMNGTLRLALQQGQPVPGLSGVNLVSVMNLSLREGSLVALVKVTGSKSENVALINLNNAHTGTLLMRTGMPVSVGGKDSTIKSLTVLNPAPLSPGDGRWHGNGNLLVRATLADKRVAIFRAVTNGNLFALLASGDNASAVVNGATYKGFGFPAIAPSVLRFAMLATLNKQKGAVSAQNDSAILYSANGATFTPLVVKGDQLNGATYTWLSDPLLGGNGTVTLFADLKEGKKKKRTLLAAVPNTGVFKVVQVGEVATNAFGEMPWEDNPPRFSKLLNFALANGATGEPVIVAQVSGKGVSKKNNLGIWAVDSEGFLRQLLRSGDMLDNRTVKSFTLLKAVPTAFSAARSTNRNNGIAVAVTFTDRTSAVLRLNVP